MLLLMPVPYGTQVLTVVTIRVWFWIRSSTKPFLLFVLQQPPEIQHSMKMDYVLNVKLLDTLLYQRKAACDEKKREMHTLSVSSHIHSFVFGLLPIALLRFSWRHGRGCCLLPRGEGGHKLFRHGFVCTPSLRFMLPKTKTLHSSPDRFSI